jgi:hypothetical protein
VRIYSDETEGHLHAQQQTRAWARNGFMTPEQKDAVDKLTPVNVRRTNVFLRALLAAFTLVCLLSVLGLIYWTNRPMGQSALACLCWAGAIPAYAAAEILAQKIRLYRFGIEEALAVGAAALVSAGVGLLITQSKIAPNIQAITVFATIALTLFWLYTRFGWMYAAFASAIALSVIPFQLHLSDPVARLLLAAVLSVLFFFTYAFSMHTRPDFQRSRNQVLQASLLFGIYLAFNLQLEALPLFKSGWQAAYGATTRQTFPTIYWITYVLCWAHALGLILWGLQRRRRVLLDVGILTLGITLATNKDYWGLAHQPWDPIVFGLFWIALAAAAHRFLSDKDRAARWKLTGDNILKPENHGLDLAAIGVALSAPIPAAPHSSAAPFGGGESGGAGTSRDF